MRTAGATCSASSPASRASPPPATPSARSRARSVSCWTAEAPSSASSGACTARHGARRSPPTNPRPPEESPPMKTAIIRIRTLKLTIPLDAAALPGDLVPPEGPAGDPVLDLVLEESTLTVRARLNGKNYRKLMKQVAEHGAA